MVSTVIVLRVRSGRYRSQWIWGTGDHNAELEAVVRADGGRRQRVLCGQDRRLETAGGRRYGGVLRRQDSRRHQEEPEPRRRVQKLPAATGHARQEHTGLFTGRVLWPRITSQKHWTSKGFAPKRIRRSAVANFEKKYIKYVLYVIINFIYLLCRRLFYELDTWMFYISIIDFISCYSIFILIMF